MKYRSELAIQNEADAFISIHVNSLENTPNVECPNANGFEIIYRSVAGNGDTDHPGRFDDIVKGKKKDEDKENQRNAQKHGKNLANIIFNQLKNSNTLIPNNQYAEPYIDVNGGKRESIAVLRRSRYPAILIQTGYICNEEDRSKLNDNKNKKKTQNTQDKIAEAIYNGLVEYGKQNDWFK